MLSLSFCELGEKLMSSCLLGCERKSSRSFIEAGMTDGGIPNFIQGL